MRFMKMSVGLKLFSRARI